MASNNVKELDINQRKSDGHFNFIEAFKERDSMTREQLVNTFDKWVEHGTYETLYKRGFRNIDAVDPSSSSKEAAMKIKLYKRYIVDFVDDIPLEINSDEYDCVASSGGFSPGLMPCVALKEMIRVVKQGGMVCFSVPDYIFTSVEEYRGKFESLMDEYVSQGFWEQVSRTPVENYLYNRPGVIFVYKVLTSEVF